MLRSVELFAGGGGMALGMQRAGFQPDQLVELHEPACETLKQNARLNPQLWKEEHVRHMDVLDWLREAPSLGLTGVDLIAGGPPCQPFSISGAHAGENDARNMFPAAVEAVRLLEPKAFIFENVPGLLRPAFAPYFEYIKDQLEKPSITPRTDETWDQHHKRIIASKTRSLRYRVQQEIVEAASFGVPQSRVRVFLVGIREDIAKETSGRWNLERGYSREKLLTDQWVTGMYWERHNIQKPAMPTNVTNAVAALAASPILELLDKTEPWRTTRDGLRQLPEPIDGKDHPKILNHRGIAGARAYRGHTGGWYEWPAKTLKAGVHGVCGGEAMIRFTDGSVRYLTPREAARVQSFPDDYRLPDVRTLAMRLLGNAVAVDAAYGVGKYLRTFAFPDSLVPETPIANRRRVR